MGARCTPCTTRWRTHSKSSRDTRGIASFMGGGMCRAGTGSDGHPIHADIAFEGLSSGAIVGDRELGDVSLRNLVGSNLVTMHHSDVDPYGVINAGVADKNKKYAKAIADHEIDGCMALVVNAGGGVSKDLSKLIYRLARKRDGTCPWTPAGGRRQRERRGALAGAQDAHGGRGAEDARCLPDGQDQGPGEPDPSSPQGGGRCPASSSSS